MKIKYVGDTAVYHIHMTDGRTKYAFTRGQEPVEIADEEHAKIILYSDYPYCMVRNKNFEEARGNVRELKPTVLNLPIEPPVVTVR